MSEFKIISIKQEDLDILQEMIIEFAKYEHMLDFLQCTKEKLEQSLLKNQFARAFLLKEDDKTIGYMIYFYTFSSFWGSGGIYLEDIYIREAFRKKGYGKMVFKFLAQLCKKENLKRLDWVCLNDNIIGIEFYQSLKAEHLKQWRSYRLSGENLEKLCDLC
ncbi:GNAT family N-acetyltransferase [Campylobacter sp. VicNov18]|uniref:GNAT family N-acetyltransferase n=1 Tax=Campylobacter bilis TaxID=2691918 RepID=UPI00130EAB10|nr:GNAT family N-acetyltransferase [Campylobacter bilis]MPV63863.1 GNAT family N-acetyltransferase [Campylobacter hepaticus]MBM0637364.1 GNAT family N-acetyltransferase [Campylobacter bilis]MCC8278085.1 GNAT family N-acetyltransferase [Campylobacter bilis]MCC8299589.1 GNAT family N-acetyltransferase [Campylobacter bilis]MCC8300994.1 GNAT family N-acetyltransferase [Campylobacter bilis]